MEQVVDFKDPVSGKRKEMMLFRDDSGLSEFLGRYQLEESEIKRK